MVSLDQDSPKVERNLQEKVDSKSGDIETLRKVKLSDKTNTIAMKLKLGLAQDNAPHQKASNSQEMRLFIGHLCPEIDENSLRDYFSSFGNVIDVFFPQDSSGGMRGFAFVTFSRLFGEHPTKTPKHVVNGCEIYIDISHYKHDEEQRSQTLLVSGLINKSSDETINKHFSKYGKVVTVIRSTESRKKLGSRWAFVHFEDCKSVDKALDDPIHIIDGHTLDLRRARDFQYNQKKGNESVSKVESAASSNILFKKLVETKNHAVDVKKLLIHNLDFSTTTDTLRSYFSNFGTVVDAYIPTVYGTSDSKGFGYIVMPSKDAKFNFSNHVIDNRVVHISKECTHHLAQKTSTILVSAGPEVMAKVKEEDFRKFFSKFGKITSVRKPTDSFSKKTSHYAFVEFMTCDAVEKAMGECFVNLNLIYQCFFIFTENLSYMINGQIVSITKSRFEPHK